MTLIAWLLLLSQGLIVLVGFAVLRAARRRPRTVAGIIGALVAGGLAAIGFGADAAFADLEFGLRCFGTGLALVILGCPAWLLVAAAQQPDAPTISWAAVVDLVKFLPGYLSDPFWAKPNDRVRQLCRLVGVLFAYLFACWILALAVAVLIRLTTSPPGSFR